MKINDYHRIGAAYQSYSKNNEPTKAHGIKKQDQYEKLELSDAARQQLQKEKEEKIQLLKQQVANGTYQVDSNKLADKLFAVLKNGGKADV
jgi:negative regulator of flagellin synthesis FlgM